jgi:hypothetical protein
MNVAEMTKHEEAFKGWIAVWEKGGDHCPSMYGVPADDDPVYSKNVDKIGVLGSEAADVVRFYSMLKALRVRLRGIEAGRLGEMPNDRKIDFTKETIAVRLRTLSIGEDLVNRL